MDGDEQAQNKIKKQNKTKQKLLAKIPEKLRINHRLKTYHAVNSMIFFRVDWLLSESTDLQPR